MISPLRSVSPQLRVHRPSLDEASDYFSQPLARQSFKRTASDSVVASFAAFERGSPFGRPNSGHVQLPQLEQIEPEEIAPSRRRSSTQALWQGINRRQGQATLQCLSACLVVCVTIPLGFVLGLYVALNHLDPPLPGRG